MPENKRRRSTLSSDLYDFAKRRRVSLGSSSSAELYQRAGSRSTLAAPASTSSSPGQSILGGLVSSFGIRELVGRMTGWSRSKARELNAERSRAARETGSVLASASQPMVQHGSTPAVTRIERYDWPVNGHHTEAEAGPSIPHSSPSRRALLPTPTGHDLPSTTPAEGTADQPIELEDEDDEAEVVSSDGSSPEDPQLLSPSPPPEPIPQPRIRPPPSRPNLSDYQAPSRSYSWMTPTKAQSLSSTTSRSSKGSRDRHRSTYGFGSMYKDVDRSQAINLQAARTLQRLAKSGDMSTVKDAANGALKLFQPTKKAPRTSAGLKLEQHFKKEGGDSKARYGRFFLDLMGKKTTTVDDLITPPTPTAYEPAVARKTAASARAHATSLKDPLVEDLLKNLKVEDEELERRVQEKLRPTLPARLSPKRAQMVAKHLSNPAFVSRCKNGEVKSGSLIRLKPQQWLDDEVINFYGAMVQARADEAVQGKGKDQAAAEWKDVHYFSSFFYQKLSEQGYEGGRLKRWTRKVDVFSKQLILIPINLGNMHWTAATINLEKKRLEYYDSMGDHGRVRRRIFANLYGYLEIEHLDKKQLPFDRTGWTECFDAGTPQQNNGSDCGVFTCQTLETLSRGKDLTRPLSIRWEFEATNMGYLRDLMILEIGQGTLEPRWVKEVD